MWYLLSSSFLGARSYKKSCQAFSDPSVCYDRLSACIQMSGLFLTACLGRPIWEFWRWVCTICRNAEGITGLDYRWELRVERSMVDTQSWMILCISVTAMESTCWMTASASSQCVLIVGMIIISFWIEVWTARHLAATAVCLDTLCHLHYCRIHNKDGVIIRKPRVLSKSAHFSRFVGCIMCEQISSQACSTNQNWWLLNRGSGRLHIIHIAQELLLWSYRSEVRPSTSCTSLRMDSCWSARSWVPTAKTMTSWL